MPENNNRRFKSKEEFEQEIDKLYAEEENYINGEHSLSKNRYLLARDNRKLIGNSDYESYKYEYIEDLLLIGKKKKDLRTENSAAIKKFRRALDIDTQLPIAHYRLGHLYYSLDDYTESCASFMRSLNTECKTFTKFSLDSVQEATAKKFVTYFSISNLMLYLHDSVNHEKYPELDRILNQHIDFIKGKWIKYQFIGEEPKLINQDDYEVVFAQENVIIIDRFDDDHSLLYLVK